MPESRVDFLRRLRQSAAKGALEVRFGLHHFSHAVCREGDRWCLRRLEVTPAERDAYMAERGFYMPESEEEIAKPRTLIFEAESLEVMVAYLERMSWPCGT